MDGKKGIIAGLFGATTLIFILFMILTSGAKIDTDMTVEKNEFNRKWVHIQKDIYDTEASIVSDKKAKKLAEQKSQEMALELDAIHKEKLKALKRQKELEDKERKGLDAIEREFDKVNDSENSFFFKADEEDEF